MSEPRIVALVPMRHGSERVRGKNHRPFAGRPLYRHIVESLLLCQRISEVVIDTDSPPIQEDVAKTFPDVRLIERPEHLREGTVPMNEVIRHDAALVHSDHYLQTHSTNPLLQPATLEAMIERYLTQLEQHDSLFSVTRHQKRFWTQARVPLNHDPANLLRTQDLPPIYEENSCAYLFSRRVILERGNRIGENPQLFEIDPIEAWDLDEEHDFLIAEALYHARHQGQSKP
ncbi:MAG TPA: acylneuraminate cytidylyltransferase family protein [Polyangiales bacterium]|nr:acylneuraminate cytidylyltransferase family protein [Polyangiales bacterium]